MAKYVSRQLHWIKVALQDPRPARVTLALTKLSNRGVSDVFRGLKSLGTGAITHPAFYAIRRRLIKHQWKALKLGTGA